MNDQPISQDEINIEVAKFCKSSSDAYINLLNRVDNLSQDFDLMLDIVETLVRTVNKDVDNMQLLIKRLKNVENRSNINIEPSEN